MPARNFTDSEEAQIAEIYLAGNSARSIAKAYGLSHHISICAALKRQGVEQRAPAERNRLYQLNPRAFDVIDNELAAYWWGFLYADGCVSRRTLIVRLKRSDAGHIYSMRDFMDSESPIKDILGNCANGKKYAQAHIELTDRHLVSRLRSLGIVRDRTRFDRVLSNLPESLYNHWIRGYFDGDGSARKSASLAICGQEDLLVWMRGVFAQHAGTNPDLAVTKHRTANIHYLYISGRLQALKAVKYMYRDASLWLGRKRQVIDSWPTPQLRVRDALGRYS